MRRGGVISTPLLSSVLLVTRPECRSGTQILSESSHMNHIRLRRLLDFSPFIRSGPCSPVPDDERDASSCTIRVPRLRTRPTDGPTPCAQGLNCDQSLAAPPFQSSAKRHADSRHTACATSRVIGIVHMTTTSPVCFIPFATGQVRARRPSLHYSDACSWRVSLMGGEASRSRSRC